jgi:hypothetical protein
MNKTKRALKRLYRDALYYHLIKRHYSIIRAKIKVRMTFH